MPSEDKLVNILRKMFLQNPNFFFPYVLSFLAHEISLESVSGNDLIYRSSFYFVLTCWLRKKDKILLNSKLNVFINVFGSEFSFASNVPTVLISQ